MAIAATFCRGQLGLTAPLVRVEVNLAAGLPVFSIVGLPATAVKESKERVRAALANSGFEFPCGRITVSLAPAELPKEGGRALRSADRPGDPHGLAAAARRPRRGGRAAVRVLR
ncbi:MAG TPA: magnesium chelatase domain-containing protein [Steroidobacteraceae bacterium]|nr:magnesium chelatase domain-containing protein [Steroidobacteraceae bacterium]